MLALSLNKLSEWLVYNKMQNLNERKLVKSLPVHRFSFQSQKSKIIPQVVLKDLVANKVNTEKDI